MQNDALKLLNSPQQYAYFILLLLCIAALNICYFYFKYLEFKSEELFIVQARVLNIYKKEHFEVIKLKTNDFEFFTSYAQNQPLKQLQNTNVMIVTSKVNFIEFLKGFYAPSINVYPTKEEPTLKQNLLDFVQKQHEEQLFKEFYGALFFAVPISKELRQICANFGISHLIAISGFHLGVIVFVVYWLIYYPYSFLHQRYFSYRNKKFDILLIASAILLIYLLFTSLVPSLLRAFVMFVLGLYMLRCNIKVLSFETLFLTLLIILALFPHYIFSLSLWFSISGVFYIFLFLHYFKHLPKVGQLILFNFWIYFAMYPITNYFFGTISYLQLFSPLLTALFTIFYPIHALLHLLNVGDISDAYLLNLFKINAYTSEVLTPFYFFVLFVICSLLSIIKTQFFWVLNGLMLGFVIYLFYTNSTHFV
jgi:competence protein ComEC